MAAVAAVAAMASAVASAVAAAAMALPSAVYLVEKTPLSAHMHHRHTNGNVSDLAASCICQRANRTHPVPFSSSMEYIPHSLCTRTWRSEDCNAGSSCKIQLEPKWLHAAPIRVTTTQKKAMDMSQNHPRGSVNCSSTPHTN